ncbi:MAG: HD domain-containing protein [Candidatus Omnitrophica bacterium]|nr:HD domain-containing protein [Candidatus Omnitrophota bacterium]
MKSKEVEHQKDLFKQLIENESFKKESCVLKTMLEKSNWWVAEDGKSLSCLSGEICNCSLGLKNKGGSARCRKLLEALPKRAKRLKRPVRFDCGVEKFGVAIPVIQGDKTYGYIIICHSKNEISNDAIELFINFLDTLIRELQKKLELSKLYETIRPRAIALSTIHTIHRIISSTLNLDELLPKLARLCLQIFRAEKCCIVIKSSSKKPIIIMTVSANSKGKGSSSFSSFCKRMLTKEKVLSKGRILSTRSKLCVPLTDEDIIGAICIMNKENGTPFDIFDKEILLTLSEQAAVAIKNAQLYKEQESITIGSIRSLVAALDTRKAGSYKVRESFVRLVTALGKELKLSAEDVRSLRYAAILHDTGQMAFPDELLTKSEKLTGKEYDIIKKHPHKSVSIIKHLVFLKPVIPIILHHHENYDGSGYPKGLKGDQIPFGARIMGLASAFNAMTTKRPYRKKVAVDIAISEIKKNSGTQFDPKVVGAFLNVIQNPDLLALIRKGL